MLTPYSIVLRLPSRDMAKELHDWRLQPLPFALIDKAENILHSGVASLISLAEQLRKAKKINFIVAASDVTLLNMAVPPLSPEKLRLALPALVENSIISDPATCHIVAGADIQGVRRVAVIDRAWFSTMISVVQKVGVKVSHAYPAQLCLPLHANSVTASVMETADKADLSMRWTNNVALGIAINKKKNSDSKEDDVCRALFLLAPKEPIQLSVEVDRVQAYSAAVSRVNLTADNIKHAEINKIQIIPDDWKVCLSEIKKSEIDLMEGASTSLRERESYAIWSLPLALTALLFFLNVVALHIDWWRMHQEQKQLTTSLDKLYKKYFMQAAQPDQQLVKLQEKLLSLRQKKGNHAPEDFLSMLANTSTAWKKISREDKKASSNSLINNPSLMTAQAITKITYSNAELRVSMKSSMAPDSEQAKSLLAENHLYLQRNEKLSEANSSEVVWNLRVKP